MYASLALLSLPISLSTLGCLGAKTVGNEGPGGGSSSSSSSSGGASMSSSSGASSSSSGGSGGSSGSGSSSGATGAAPIYKVVGPDIIDAQGNKHLFRGVDRPSLEWSAQGSNLSPADYMTMKTWGANVVRIALNQDFWINDPANSNFDSGYESNVDDQVQAAEAAGLDVILDLHWSDGGDYTKTPGQWCMADQHSIIFWTQVANKYKTDPHVLFELYNEPYVTDWGVWLSGGMTTCNSNNNGMTSSSTFQVAGMQQLNDTVRATGAQNLIVIGGINYAFDLSNVGHGYRVVDASGNPAPNVIYNTHPYNITGKTTLSEWYNAFGYLAATDPVIATEFGDGNKSTCNTGMYNSSIIAYFDAMAPTAGLNPANRMSWTAWAFYVGGCSFPSLLQDWQYNTTPAGDVVKASLQTFQQP